MVLNIAASHSEIDADNSSPEPLLEDADDSVKSRVELQFEGKIGRRRFGRLVCS